MCWSLIYPKLIVVWSGEKVVVGSLLRKESRQANVNSKHSNTSVSSIRSKRMQTTLFDIPVHVLRSNTLPHSYSLTHHPHTASCHVYWSRDHFPNQETKTLSNRESTAVNNNNTNDILANVSLGIEKDIHSSDATKDSPEFDLTLQTFVANKINGTSVTVELIMFQIQNDALVFLAVDAPVIQPQKWCSCFLINCHTDENLGL